MIGERKEVQNDPILVVQYRNAVFAKSLVSNYSLQLDKSHSTIMYWPSQNNDEDFEFDSVFFLQRDGISWKILRLQFCEQEDQQYVSIYHEFQSATVHMFTRQADFLCLMDESMQLKVFNIDTQLKKIKIVVVLELANQAKNAWDPQCKFS